MSRRLFGLGSDESTEGGGGGRVRRGERRGFGLGQEVRHRKRRKSERIEEFEEDAFEVDVFGEGG